MHSFLEIRTVIIVIKRTECALRRPYRTRARARLMGEVEEVQEQIKANVEVMKEKMATMMEAMMSIKKIIEVNAAAVAATNVVAEVDLIPPFVLNQINPPTSDMVRQGGKELGGTGSPRFVQVQNIHHPTWRTLPMRMSITPLPYSLKANNLNLIMHMSLNP